MLFGFWYPAMLSRDLRAGAIRAATLLELPLAIGRDAQGRAFALADLCPHRAMPLSDLCPHRAMPLSFGRVAADTVECCYHGWKFDAHSGQCRAIPSLAADANVKVERIFAKSYDCAERDGYVWVFLPDPPSQASNARNPVAPNAEAADILSKPASQNNDTTPPVPGASRFQRALPHHARQRRVSLRRRSGSARAARSCAWTLRAPVVVLALVAQFARQAKNF